MDVPDRKRRFEGRAVEAAVVDHLQHPAAGVVGMQKAFDAGGRIRLQRSRHARKTGNKVDKQIAVLHIPVTQIQPVRLPRHQDRRPFAGHPACDDGAMVMRTHMGEALFRRTVGSSREDRPQPFDLPAGVPVTGRRRQDAHGVDGAGQEHMLARREGWVKTAGDLQIGGSGCNRIRGHGHRECVGRNSRRHAAGRDQMCAGTAQRGEQGAGIRIKMGQGRQQNGTQTGLCMAQPFRQVFRVQHIKQHMALLHRVEAAKIRIVRFLRREPVGLDQRDRRP